MSQKVTECNWNIAKGSQDTRGILWNITVQKWADPCPGLYEAYHQLLKATGLELSQVSPKDSTAPVHLLLASQVTKFLFFQGSWWLMVFKQSQLRTNLLIASNTHWCSNFHRGNIALHSFF